MLQDFNAQKFLVGLIVLVVSITFHEFGHAISADRLGDPGPRRDGRVNVWPDRHFDPLGFIMMCVILLTGFGLGWGRPVLVDPRHFANPRKGMVIVAAFGPLMNLLIAVIAGLCIRFYAPSHPFWLASSTVSGDFAQDFLLFNLSLMFFNLLPLYPLDGSKILSGLMPEEMARQFDRFGAQYGSFILLGLIFLGGNVLGRILNPPVIATARLILGPSLGL